MTQTLTLDWPSISAQVRPAGGEPLNHKLVLEHTPSSPERNVCSATGETWLVFACTCLFL